MYFEPNINFTIYSFATHEVQNLFTSDETKTNNTTLDNNTRT